MQTIHVRVKRSFYFDRKPTKVDSVVELPKPFALEMIAAHKAEAVDKPAEPAAKTEEKRGGLHAR